MKRVLVIEDEQIIRESIIEILQINGFEAQGASDGERGLALARHRAPDMVICDVMMDKMDGFGVLEKVRQDARLGKTPFIFLTALADHTTIRHGMSAGADDYITKPFTTQQLLDVINQRLHANSTIRNDTTVLVQRITDSVITKIADKRIDSKNVEAIVQQYLYHLSSAELKSMTKVSSDNQHLLQRLKDQISWFARLDANIVNHANSDAVTYAPLRSIWMTAINTAHEMLKTPTTVDIRIDESHPHTMIYGNFSALQHAFAEIITNALEHAKQDSQITLNQWATDEYGWFSVTDNGSGLTQQIINDVYSDEIPLGLGLNLARRLTDVHGGKLRIDTSANKGTIVAVRLPKP